MSHDILEPHIKYSYGQLNNLFYLINHNQHCAKISPCTIFSGNDTKHASVHLDRPLRTPHTLLARVVARSDPSRFTLTIARLAYYGRLAGPHPPHQFIAPPAHVALKAYVANIYVKCL
jgi:hypothetical protein